MSLHLLFLIEGKLHVFGLQNTGLHLGEDLPAFSLGLRTCFPIARRKYSCCYPKFPRAALPTGRPRPPWPPATPFLCLPSPEAASPTTPHPRIPPPAAPRPPFPTALQQPPSFSAVSSGDSAGLPPRVPPRPIRAARGDIKISLTTAADATGPDADTGPSRGPRPLSAPAVPTAEGGPSTQLPRHRFHPFIGLLSSTSSPPPSPAHHRCA